KPRWSLKRFIVPKESNDDVSLQSFEPFIFGFQMSLTARSFGKFGLKFFRTGESPRRITARMGPEAGRVAAIAHIPDKQQTVRIPEMHLRFKEAIGHHPRRQVIAYEENAGALVKLEVIFIRFTLEEDERRQ